MTYSGEYQDIVNHPYTQALIESGEFVVDHPYNVDENKRSYSLTAGTLAGENLIAHTPLTLVRQRKVAESIAEKIPSEESQSRPAQIAEYIVFYHLGGKLCGHPGIIHGGLLATLLDESLCRCGFPSLPNKLGVTASLNIKYLAPTKADSIAVLHAWVTKLDGRKVTVKGTLSTLDQQVEGTEVGVIPEGVTLENVDEKFKLKNTVSAEALVIEPRWVSKLQTGHFTPPQDKGDAQLSV